ncbi:serine hydrolase domain-containing protein [Sphingobacterium sp. SGR-19]|uniref:serine hydrolase domain-containing protein n=1 Tax=Sphingobacterium sp. SGR-19 TaxID=2710886 RepID=UPI0013EB90B3|nr:serine hydrolase domain-containing protein [Sphingobacterium sp. SGR-19]NGM67014.1 beta-lactamase family protein [Sphingobacterium sp. SGR-19]
MIRILFFLLLTCTALTGLGQTKTEEANRAVFNKIEFFINTQMTDSIYNLASEAFREQVSKDQLAFMLQNLYQLGRIIDVEVEDFKGQTATYRVSFTAERQLLAKLAVDSTFRYTTLAFTATDNSTKKVEKPEKEEVISQVATETRLDYYIDSVANTYIRKGNTQSLSIAVFHKNKYTTFLYGETEKGNNTLPTENTLYEIGSITKVFTATLLADLVTKDVIRLDDSIMSFLPDSVSSNPALKGITFKTLANHTSGLPRMGDNWNRVAGYNEKDPFATYDQKALFSFLKNYKASREPGEEYEYSNLGYGLLSELIAIVCKKNYIQCLEETILKPLQLNHTTDKPDAKKQQIISPGLDKEGNTTPLWNWEALIGAGGLKSNIRDLMLFAVEQFKMPENELQKAMALTRQFTFFTPENLDIGLAWRISMMEDGIIYFHHTGGTAGSSSFVGLSPDTKTAVVILSNASESVLPISREIMEKLLAE